MKKLKIFALALICAFIVPALLAGCNNNDGGKATLSIYQEFTQYYEVGQELDVSGGKVKYTSKNGKEEIVPIVESMISGFTKTTAGTRTMTITYEDAQLSLTYKVFESVKNGWYRSATTIDDGFYMYFGFNTNTKTITMFSANTTSPNFSDYENNPQINYTQSITSSGIKLTASNTVETRITTYEITVVSQNQFSLYMNAVQNGTTLGEQTLTFEFCA